MITTLSATDFILQNIDTSSLNVNNQNKRMILLVKANWCHFCNEYLPIYESYSNTLTDYKFYILEHTQDESLINSWANMIFPSFQVKSFPTLIIYDINGMPITIVKDRNNLKEELNNA